MLRSLRPRPEPLPARLYTRDGCLLCDELVEQLERAGLLRQLALEAVDVDADRALKKRYGLRIPVLEVAGEEVFEGRPEPELVRRTVGAALERARAGGDA